MSGKETERCVFAVVVFATMMSVLPGGAPAGVIFSDDFESGTLFTGDSPPGQWASLWAEGGSASVVNSPHPVFDGTYSCLHDWQGGNRIYLSSPQWGDQLDLYFKLYVYVHDWTSGDMPVCRLTSTGSGASADSLCILEIDFDTKVLKAVPGPAAGGGTYPGGTGTTPLEEDRWYCIELHYQHCTAAGSNDGEVAVWLNGNIEIDATGFDTSYNGAVWPVVSWMLGSYSAAVGNIYYDNVSVSDNAAVYSIEVLSPVSGEKWAVGSVHEIRWITGDTAAVPDVHIQLSRNNGTNWEDIESSIANTGSYPWTVTDGSLPLPQDQCLIRISDVVDGIPQDASGLFSITGATIAVTNPGGGEEWGAGGPRTITWTTEGTIAIVDILISRDGGTVWEDLGIGVANSGSYIWSVTDGGQMLPQSNCVIRVRDNTDHGLYDDSESFTVAAGSIVVTLPVGGESWEAGIAQEIHWTSNVGAGVSVAIAVSYDGGEHYQTLTRGSGTANDGVSFFGVPDHPTTHARVRVSSGTMSGESPDFTITPQDYSWLFQDGFEDGIPGNWDSVSANDISEVNQVAAPVLSGAWACESHLLCSDDGTSASVSKDVDGAGDGLAALCLDGWVRLEALPDTSGGSYSIHVFGMRARNTSGSSNVILYFFVTGDSPTPLLEFFSNRRPPSDVNGGWPNDISHPEHGDILPLGVWHRLVCYYRPSTVDNAEDGIVSFYHDENDGNGLQEIVTVTGKDTSSGSGTDGVRGVLPPETMFTAGAFGGGVTSIDATIYYDDVGANTNDPGGPFPVVLGPSGGEEWIVGAGADITWHVRDKLEHDITHVDIEISRDNGGTWPDIVASNVDVSTLAYDAVTDSYTYTWDPVTDGGLPTVPPQDQCLIRVTDATVGNPGNSDECDFNFRIGQAQVTVLAPNGGEVWGIGTNRDITWDYFGLNAVLIEISYDNGTNWNNVSLCLALDRSYTWTVSAPMPSAICLVRISDTGTSGATDVSDNTFSIIDPTIQVTAPNGGEAFDVGETTSITWNSTGLLNVKIELSRDNGTSWEEIIASTDASAGTYAWTVTGPLSANCLVRVSDVDDDPVDDSNATFTVQGVLVTVPNGGETWDTGSTQAITWDAAGVAQIDIEVSRDNGSNWETVTTNLDATLGTYDWDVTGPGSAQCIVRISESTTGSPSDQSDAMFTIAGVTVTSPTGGEFWSLSENVNITWNSGGLATVIIELSRDGNWVNGDGSDVEILVASTDATVGSWGWVVTGPSSTTCLVRISDLDGAPSDVSDAVFEILAPAITVTSPTAGDAWPVGSSQDITWTSTGIMNMKIDVSHDGGTSWVEIVASTPALAGSYTWVSVTGPTSATCVIRVRDAANPWTIYGDSAGFTISEIAVTAPVAGDTWCYDGDDQDITWTSAGVTSNMDIAYSTDGGITWTDIATNESDDASYTWTIPDEDSTNCMVRVEETGGGGAVGLSGVFTLTPATITVTLPVAGGSWGVGTSQTVEWTSPGLANVMIELSRDGNWVNGDGSDVGTIIASTDATTGSYTWASVTGPESTNCLVRVSDANDGVPSGVSGTFTIATASLALVLPDGGEIWSIGKTATVTWDQVGVTAVQIELSTDGGTTWTEIIPDADGQVGSYAWTLNAAASGNCTVRITAGGALTDSSAGTFWIIKPNGDTDGDGFTDQEEVDGGTNPFDKDDKPPVMFHGKTGCGFAMMEGGLPSSLMYLLVTIAAGLAVVRRKGSDVR